jgi:hypothetical protein
MRINPYEEEFKNPQRSRSNLKSFQKCNAQGLTKYSTPNSQDMEQETFHNIIIVPDMTHGPRSPAWEVKYRQHGKDFQATMADASSHTSRMVLAGVSETLSQTCIKSHNFVQFPKM